MDHVHHEGPFCPTCRYRLLIEELVNMRPARWLANLGYNEWNVSDLIHSILVVSRDRSATQAAVDSYRHLNGLG
jgi:hypothetical protein